MSRKYPCSDLWKELVMLYKWLWSHPINMNPMSDTSFYNMTSPLTPLLPWIYPTHDLRTTRGTQPNIDIYIKSVQKEKRIIRQKGSVSRMRNCVYSLDQPGPPHLPFIFEFPVPEALFHPIYLADWCFSSGWDIATTSIASVGISP